MEYSLEWGVTTPPQCRGLDYAPKKLNFNGEINAFCRFYKCEMDDNINFSTFQGRANAHSALVPLPAAAHW